MSDISEICENQIIIFRISEIKTYTQLYFNWTILLENMYLEKFLFELISAKNRRSHLHVSCENPSRLVLSRAFLGRDEISIMRKNSRIAFRLQSD